MIGVICGWPCVYGITLKVCYFLNTGHKCLMACMMVNITVKPPKSGIGENSQLREVVSMES